MLLHGHPPSLVNLAMFALATRTNPDFHWVEVGNHSDRNEPLDPVLLGWVSEGQLFRVDLPERFGPNPDVAQNSLFGMIRSDEPPEELASLTAFLQLPELSQRILGGPSFDDRPGVVAVANAQRVRERFPTELISSILEVHRRAGFSVLVGCDGKLPLHSAPFEFVFRIEDDGRPLERWNEAALICEKGVESGPLGGRRPMRLGDIPLLAELLARAHDPG